MVQAVHDQLCGLMEDHKESRDPEPLTIGKGEVKQALAANGVSQEHIQAFEREYDQAFGPDAQLSPRNLVDPKKAGAENRRRDHQGEPRPQRPGPDQGPQRR